MTDRRALMIADRRVRDTARAVVEADFAHLKANLSRKGLSERAMDRVAEGAQEVYDEAVEVASDNKGALAAIVAALVLWFARNPILDAVFGDEDETDAEDD
ncbi:hypothetical protein [Qipengyuania sp. MTN3-11]|uniref:hypothetical protein n=1 Tax=Qipengyuania sp. MTN3-11 TaxID=3056557 RepID=UPI0036F1D6A5